MYAKLLIKQAQRSSRRSFMPASGVGDAGTVPGSKETPPTESVLAALAGMSDDPESRYHQSAKFLDSILHVPGKVWDNPVATGVGAPIGAWGVTTGRELANKYLRAGRGKVPMIPRPDKAVRELFDVAGSAGVRTPAQVFRDASKYGPLVKNKKGGLVRKRVGVSALKPTKVNLFKVIGDSLALGRKRTGATKGVPRALAEKLFRGGFGDLLFRKKPGAKTIITSTLAGAIASAVAADKFKKR